MQLQIILLLQVVHVFWAAQAPEKCVYQLDMENNRFKITCGPGAVINIIDQHGNTLLSGETSSKAETPVVFQLNRSSIASLNDETSKATKKLTDASRLLRKVREELTQQVSTLLNLTSLLQKGDVELQKDLDTLRRNELNSPLVREAIIAALQNQYNFLRMGLLSQNTRLDELIHTSLRLTTSIMKTARGARGVGEILDLRSDVMNETLHNITKLMPGGFEHGTFFGESTVFCPQELKRISKKGTSIVNGVEQGTLMRDPYFPDKLWVTLSFTNVNQVTEYSSIQGLKFEMAQKKYELPFSCVGTGHVIYKKILYCQKMFTNKIVRYSLAESRWLGEKQFLDIGVQGTYPYQSGKSSDLDFAVDETGLWLIYATNASRGNIVISKLKEDDLSFENTWVTEIPKRQVGNSFIICGVLYAVDSYDKIPTFVKYIYDTNIAKGRELVAEEIPFLNSISGDIARVYTLDYSPGDKALFSWNNGRMEIFPVSFSDANEP